MNIKNNRRKFIFEYFPEDIGFVENADDPLNIILTGAAEIIRLTELDLTDKIDNIFLDYMNPTMPIKIFYKDVLFFGDKIDNSEKLEISESPTFSGTTQIVDTQDEFISSKITGVGRAIMGQSDEVIIPPSGIFPTGILPSGVVGISYGFDWNESHWYLTRTDGEFIYTAKEVKPSGVPASGILEFYESINIVTKTQSFDEVAKDEYINFQEANIDFEESWNMIEEKEITVTGLIVKEGVKLSYILDNWEKALSSDQYDVSPGIDGRSVITIYPLQIIGTIGRTSILVIKYKYRHATLNNVPISDFHLIDILNFDAFGEGLELLRTFEDDDTLHVRDYVLHNDKVYLNNTDINKYNSRYIAEYNYEIEDKATYLTQPLKRHYIGLKSVPKYKLDE